MIEIETTLSSEWEALRIKQVPPFMPGRAVCHEEGIRVAEMKGGSRRRQVSLARKRIVRELIEEYGIPMAMVARATGVTAAAISKLMTRC
jgi:hypothetical protein